MEVHHHPHVEKKNFKEYLLEGLMIFLAVSMGFAAENIRERLVEKEREHQYIQSLYEDLTADEKSLEYNIAGLNAQIRSADTLLMTLKKTSLKDTADQIYFHFRKIIRQTNVATTINDRAYIQMKNSGEMRLIRDKNLSDSIMNYYHNVTGIDYLQTFSKEYKNKLREIFTALLNSEDYAKLIDDKDRVIKSATHSYLRSTDSNTINACSMQISDIKGVSLSILENVKRLQRRGASLKKYINDHYEVKQTPIQE